MHVFWGRKKDCSLVPQIDLRPRLDLDFVGEFGVHARTGDSERLQCGWSFQRAIDQHAASGMRCFAARLAAFDHQNAAPALAQCDGKRKPDNPAADDDYVPSLHSGIVKDGSRRSISSIRGTGDRQSPAA